MMTFKNIKISWYQVFKYTIYLLLSYNIYLFLRDDLLSSNIMFSNGLSWKNIVVGFSGTIDTVAWVILLLIFELETYVIDDNKLEGGLKGFLKTISIICYAFIVYSFYGYLKKYMWFFDFQSFSEAISICEQLGKSWLRDFDDYIIITTENCKSLSQNTQHFILPSDNIITNLSALKSAKRIALIDVFNSFAWLVVVITLEIDVWLQLKNKLLGRVKKISNTIKIVAYSTLVIAVISWGYSEIILDTWDAFLWIVAFVFIEMNLFKWQKEIESKKNNDH